MRGHASSGRKWAVNGPQVELKETGFPWESEDDNVLCLRAFLAAYLGEADSLSFRQGFEAISLDRTEMHEQVAAIVTLDEAETLGFVEPFDGSFLHICHIDSLGW